MNSPRRDTFWPPILLALALACVVAFLIMARQSRPVEPVAKPPPGDTATVGTRRLSIEFLDVGQGDSALIRSPEGKLALVDAGPTNRVVKLLRDRGVTQLDLVVVSHHHADHYGGMLAVLKAFKPRVFLDAASPHSSRAYEAVLRRVRDSGMTAIQPNTDAPREIKLGTVLLTVLPQPPVDSHNENNNSIGLRVDFGDFAALLTGDSEVAERAWWTRHVPNLCAGVSVLKLAHHGSRNGTDLGWLRLTRPGLAVASLGLNNDYGHPHPETLRRLAQAEVPLDRTDTEGTITIVTDGVTWSDTSAQSDLGIGEATAIDAGAGRPPIRLCASLVPGISRVVATELTSMGFRSSLLGR